MYKAKHSFTHDGETFKRGETVKFSEKTLEALARAGLVEGQGVDADAPAKPLTKKELALKAKAEKDALALPDLPLPPPV